MKVILSDDMNLLARSELATMELIFIQIYIYRIQEHNRCFIVEPELNPIRSTNQVEVAKAQEGSCVLCRDSQ